MSEPRFLLMHLIVTELRMACSGGHAFSAEEHISNGYSTNAYSHMKLFCSKT